MDYGLVNAFLALEDLSEHESLLRQNVMSLHEAMQRVGAERARLAQELQKKEQEFLKVSGALENQLSVVEHLAKQKGLEPLQPEVEEKAE